MVEGLRIVLWNIHRGKEHPGRSPTFPEALAALGPIDLLCLVEADTDWPESRAFLDLDAIAGSTGLVRPEGHAVTGPSSHGFLGLLCLVSSRITLRRSRAFHLPSLREPRGLLLQDLDTPIGRMALGLTHLSLDPALRCLQALSARRILRAEVPTERLVLAGDFNEWLPLSPALRLLAPGCRQVSRRSFPAAWPLLRLDRILAGPGVALRAVEVAGTGTAQLSDHLPVAAWFEFPPPVRSSRSFHVSSAHPLRVGTS